MAIGNLGVSGNEGVQKRLWQYLNGGRIHPAILLTGSDRNTKRQVAKNIAKYLLGGDPKDVNSRLCTRIEKGLHPDVIFYQEEEETGIKVEVIRSITHQMEIAPLEAEAKVCIIDDCHRMHPAAANAFLKTLEEPFPNRYFWLLTDRAGALLPTLLSRCLEFYFKPESDLLSVEAKENFENAWQNFLKHKDPQELSSFFDTKSKAEQFLLFLEDKWRNLCVRTKQESELYHALRSFEQALLAESHLRSNANYGLMLENLLRQQLS